MDPIRHLTCTVCHWSRWIEPGEVVAEENACPRCGGKAIVGRRPDDYFPAAGPPDPFRRESDPAIAILDTKPE
jgi:DNA-directed RNA polymerase subunit RPC12/RpoP